MITNKHDSTTNGSYKVLRGLSSDTKPDAVANGSEFLEMDTGKTYLFDEDGTTWAEQPASGGGVSVEALTVTANGTYTAPEETAYSPVTVDVPTSKSDVNFYDYDGTLVAAYTAADFAGLTELPANPDRSSEGLVAQGWNWTLADAQACVASCGKLDIGQMYDTDDGATRIVIELHAPRLSPRLNFGVNGTATIDWGDNNTDTVTGTSATTQQYKVHTYATEGTYTISISVSEGGTIGFNGSLVNDNGTIYGVSPLYMNSVKSVRTASSVAAFGNSVFTSCTSLSSITIPNSVTSMGSSVFFGCYSLPFITIPNSITSLKYGAFQDCYSLLSVAIPNSITSFEDNIFENCYSLLSVTIPGSITSFGERVFLSCYSLSSVAIQSGVTSLGLSAFGKCKSLKTVTIPDGVTSIGTGVFNSCGSLSSVTIPDTITVIEGNAFASCSSLSSVIIKDNITSIGSGAFSSCGGLGFVKFEPTTPPTLASSMAFNNLPYDCVIYVPAGTLSAYTSATNYPSSSTYTYVEY